MNDKIKTLLTDIFTIKYRIIIYKLTTNSRRVYMPQRRMLNIWFNLCAEEQYCTYAEHTAFDVITKYKEPREKTIIKTIWL